MIKKVGVHMHIQRIPPVEWMNGKVIKVLPSVEVIVLGEDNLEYIVPQRDVAHLKVDDLVQFVPRNGLFRSKRWTTKIVLRP